MKKVFLYSLGALLAAFLVTSTAEAAPVNHETVLSGEVVSVVSVGTSVKEGDPLLTVQTLGGPMVASPCHCERCGTKQSLWSQVLQWNEVKL